MTGPPLPRDDFGVTTTLVYLNHAAVGVLPRPSVVALQAFLEAQASGGVLGTAPYEMRMPEYRERLARYIGASGEEIALLRSTSEGASAIAGGIDWKPGDELILCDNEFPSNVIPWLPIRERGAHVRFLDASRERLTPAVLEKTIGERTRVVAVSWVSYHDGYRHDLAGLAEVAHRHGAWLCVDAIQGLGAFPLDVRAAGVDALYGAGAKWMLALQGAGFLYVREDLIDRLTVASPGWRSVADMWDFHAYEQPWSPHALRYEGGTPNFIGARSLERAVDLFERCGPDRIAAHVLALTDRLHEGLLRAGAEVPTQRGAGISSGIVTFRMPGRDSVELGRAMQREGIVTTWRPSGIRVAPHGYNSLDEIDTALDVLGGLVKGTR